MTHTSLTQKHFTHAAAAICCALISFCLLFGFSSTAQAKEYTGVPTGPSVHSPSELSTTYVLDHYGLLSSEDLTELEKQATRLSNKVQVGIYLLIVDDIYSETARDYAKNYYMNNDLGYENTTSGILFLIAVDSRDYVTITYNKGVTVFTDYGIGRLEDNVVSELSNNNWEAACDAYYDSCKDIIDFYLENGSPYDRNNNGEFDPTFLIVGIVGGLIVSAIVCYTWYRQMKTARIKREAHDFFDKNSLTLYESYDNFINTTRSVVRIEKNTSSGGGGSSIDSGGFGGSSGGKF